MELDLAAIKRCIVSQTEPEPFSGVVSLTEGYFGLSAQEARELEIRQIEYGRENKPYMTVYQLVARRKR